MKNVSKEVFGIDEMIGDTITKTVDKRDKQTNDTNNK